jgi:cilia- and flagella-associated protein 65
VVRNVSSSTVKFKYKLPRSKYFSMEFPEPVSLMAGMSISLKVCLRDGCVHQLVGITKEGAG